MNGGMQEPLRQLPDVTTAPETGRRRRIAAANTTRLITDPEEALAVNSRYLGILGMAWVSALMLSIVVAAKTFDVGPASFSVAVLIYPVTYIFSDVFTEVYGYRQTRRIVWTGLALMMFASLVLYLCVRVPPGRDYPDNEAFKSIFASSPLIAGSAILAFWCGEMVNSFIMAKMKIVMQGKRLWMRTTSSTLAGQLTDNFVYFFMVFAITGMWPLATTLNLWVSTALFCTAYEFLATPMTYRIIHFLKRAEGMDVYDRGTNFSPFTLR